MLYDHLERNRRMTWVLFALFVLLVVGVAAVIDVLVVSGGIGPVTWFLGGLVALGAVVFAWFAADRVVLSTLGARPPNPADPRERLLPEITSGLAIAAGLPPPKVYVVDDEAPNAFATGRSPDKGVVVFTRGLLYKMSRQQTEAVAAHELSHIANRDSMIGVTAVVLVGVILIMCRLVLRLLFYGGGRRSSRRGGGGGGIIVLLGLAFLVLAPVFASLLRFAVSRRRELLADANAVRLTRNPDAMIGALEVLASDHTSVDFAHGMASHLWIEEPTPPNRGSWLDRLTLTHPPIPERIAALRAIAGHR